MQTPRRAPIAVLLWLALMLAGCGTALSPQPTPTIAPDTRTPTMGAGLAPAAPTTPPAATGVATPPRKTQIIERTAGFPRKIQAVNGIVEIRALPQRIHTLSVGYDEITFRLVDPGRIAAVGQSTADPNLSNVADLAAPLPKVGRDAEQILALRPDLVVASPFADKDLVRQLMNAGITVAVTDLVSAVNGDAENIRLLAYLYGEEARGEALVAEVEARLAKVDAVVARHRTETQSRVLFLQNNAYVSGSGSTGDGIITRAGGVNVAAAAGITGTKQISAESIIALNPDYIVLDGTPETNPAGFGQVTRNSALADIPAVKNHRVVGIRGTYLSTLSQWNVRGIEELVNILYPGQLALSRPKESP